MSILNQALSPEDMGIMLNNTHLESIFQKQKSLIAQYINLGSLPEWPLNLSLKTSQKTLKDINLALLEELGEIFESYEKLHNSIIVNPNTFSPAELTLALANLSEEVADTLHFLIELLIYAQVDEGGVSTYYRRMAKDKLIPPSIYNPNNLLSTILQVATWANIKEGYTPTGLSIKQLHPKTLGFEDNNCTLAFRLYHPAYLTGFKLLLWDFTAKLLTSQNYLKSKAWRKQQPTVDVGNYQLAVMNAVLTYFQILAYVGFTEDSLYEIYTKKNNICLNRIKENY